MHHVDSTNGVIYLIEFFLKFYDDIFKIKSTNKLFLDYKRLVASIIGLHL